VNVQSRVVAIFGGGPSMTREAADRVIAGGLYTIAVNNAWTLAPGADMLVAVDPEWWEEYPEAKSFRGQKVVMRDDGPAEVDYIKATKIGAGSNGALQAAHLATRRGAAALLLLGIDLRDDELTHHHGLHGGHLANPTVAGFKRAREAWGMFAALPGRPPVFNCSERSALTCFPKRRLADVL